VTIVIAKAKTGRRVRGACRAVTRANRGRPRCTRYVTAGTLRRSGKTAANQVAFSGRIGRRKLSPGTYRATAAAKDPAGNASAPSRTGFTIVSR
jgi:hypothetical protein